MNYIVASVDEYLLEKQSKQIIEEFLPENDEMNLIFYDALTLDWKVFVSEAQSFPFFGDYKVFVIDNCLFLTGEETISVGDEKLLDDYFMNSNLSSVVIFRLNNNIDKRKTIYKKLSKSIKIIEIEPLKEKEFIKVVNDDLKAHKIDIDDKAKEELLRRLPIDLLNWYNELNKLILYPGKVNLEVVEKIVTRSINEDVFKIVDAILQNRVKECLMITSDLLALNTDPIPLVALLATNFRLIYQVKYYLMKNKTEDEIARLLAVHPYRVKLASVSANKIKNETMLSILNDLAVLDYRFKNVGCNRELEFELFILKLMGDKGAFTKSSL